MKELPKIELHCHLDGSVRANTIYELAIKNNISIPGDDVEELMDYLVAPLDCDSLDTYLKRFDIPISVMQTKEALTRITYELIEDNALENVKYLEIRFAPLSHLKNGLSLKEVITSVLEGVNKAKKLFDIEVNMIISFMRNDKLSHLYELISVAKDFIGKGLVAIDLCASETESFIRKFIKPIKVAKDAGFKITIHAGETGFPHNVIEAVEYLDATRIGHGVAIIHDKPSLEYVASSNVLLEVCPTSNIQTKAFSSYKEHPVNEFLIKGVNLSIGTDNRTVSNVSLTDEYNILAETFAWDKDTFGKIFNMSLEACFANKKTKAWLRNISEDYYGGSA